MACECRVRNGPSAGRSLGCTTKSSCISPVQRTQVESEKPPYLIRSRANGKQKNTDAMAMLTTVPSHNRHMWCGSSSGT